MKTNKRENACPVHLVASSVKLLTNVQIARQVINFLMENVILNVQKILMIRMVLVLLILVFITVVLQNVQYVYNLSSWKMGLVLKNAPNNSTKPNCNAETVLQGVKYVMIANPVINVLRDTYSKNTNVQKDARQATMRSTKNVKNAMQDV